MKSSSELPFVILITLVVHLYATGSVNAQCACDADVNNDGIVNVLDGVCILECKQGQCNCCVNSCDVNCDGVVDDADAHQDIVNEDSAWLCMFQGGSADVCCPLTGACCDSATGACANDTIASDCRGASQFWVAEQDCGEISCQGAPTGACCHAADGSCVNGVPSAACLDPGDEWFAGESCSPELCPLPPTGACCHLGNGQCQDGQFSAACSGLNFVWSEGTTCAEIPCSVPPQDPCPCNADVNDDFVVNVLDGACILDCKSGDCACCVNSCDVNCDGIVDDADAHEDIANVDSAWLCLFQGGSEVDCCPATGACCDGDVGACAEGVVAADCQGAGQTWFADSACAEILCQPQPKGACCQTTTGSCVEAVFLGECLGPDNEWFEGQPCSDDLCPLPPTGACCHFGNGLCADDQVQAACLGDDLQWSEGAACANVACFVPPQVPCPCNGDVNDDGIVNVIDAACIIDCGLGQCACCASSCDINCDGVVDGFDANADLVNEDSTWLCLFQGGSTQACCSVDNLMPPFTSGAQPAVPVSSSAQSPAMGKQERP